MKEEMYPQRVIRKVVRIDHHLAQDVRTECVDSYEEHDVQPDEPRGCWAATISEVRKQKAELKAKTAADRTCEIRNRVHEKQGRVTQQVDLHTYMRRLHT